ncbi:MAG: DUF2268 domain-containing protein [Eudoraea sp.]|nr:DUF2268 domain-containing protein [Eudoraea sp.]
MKPTRLAFILLLLGIGACRTYEEPPIRDLHLPDIIALFELSEKQELSKKEFKFLGDTLIAANQDLQAAQLYVEAASFYHQAGTSKKTVAALHQAIEKGMANPKILGRFPGIEESLEFPEGQRLKQRLDSIKQQLEQVSHYKLEMRAMDHFWPYFDSALKDTSKAREELKKFLLQGPPEIRDFYVVRYGNLDLMYGQMINATPDYYRYLKTHIHPDSLQALQATTRKWMTNFKDLYPQAVFPKVFIVPGILNSGGTATEMGMFVGGDMYGRSEDMPTDGLSDWQKNSIMNFKQLPGLTIHELMHFQQNYKDTVNIDKVMGAIIGEGVCDFLVELSSGVPLQSDNLSYLEDPDNMNFILNELKNDLYNSDNSKWLYNGGSIEDRPHDLGYTLGYLISKSYFQNHPDKIQAVHELLNTENFKVIYKGSNYSFLLEKDTILSPSI